jgi:hypothetical protein
MVALLQPHHGLHQAMLLAHGYKNFVYRFVQLVVY